MAKRLNWNKKYQMQQDIRIGKKKTNRTKPPFWVRNLTKKGVAKNSNKATPRQRKFLKELGCIHWQEPTLTKELASEWITQLLKLESDKNKLKSQQQQKATDKQRNFLKDLGCIYWDDPTLTKTLASKSITQLLAEKNKPKESGQQNNEDPQ